MTARTLAHHPLAAAVFALALVASAAAPARRPLGLFHDALRGKWTATVTPDNGTAGHDYSDAIEFFRGGLFSSTTLAKDGFAPAAYDNRGSPIGAAATFDVTLKTKAGDTAHWQGTAAGGQMTGTLSVTRHGGEAVTYTFTAAKA